MMRIFPNTYLFCITLIFIALFPLSFTSSAAFPLLRNFSRKDYQAGTQNWGISQDPAGVMYFGNSTGMLRFDSKRWSLYRLPNFSTVRDVAVDKTSNRVFVSGTNEFGYFEFGTNAKQGVYYSLTATLPKQQNQQLGEIWKIHKVNNEFLFQGDHIIIRYDGKKCHLIKSQSKITCSFPIDDMLYLGTEDGRLMQVHGNSLQYLAGCDIIAGKKISDFVLYNNKLGIVTAFDGLFIYADGTLSHQPLSIDEDLMSRQVFCAASNGTDLAFGTVNSGIIIYNIDSGAYTHLTKEHGLQNNTVLNAWFDDLDNLWLGLDNGIDYVMCNSPFHQLLGSSVPYGAGYASLLSDHRLFLGTNQGLYIVSYSFGAYIKASDEDKPIIPGQIWSLTEIEGQVFACTDGGLYLNSGAGFSKVEHVPGCMAISKLKQHPDKLLVSSYNGFIILEKASGTWKVQNFVDGYNEVSGPFVEDDRHNIWIAHWLKGLYRLKLAPDLRKFESLKLFNEENGLPATRNITVANINGQPVFSSEQGFLSATKDNVKPMHEYDSLFQIGPTSHLYESPTGNIWQVSPEKITVAHKNSSGNYEADSLSFRFLRENIIPGFDNISFVSDDKFIFSNQDGFYEVDASHATPKRKLSMLLSLQSGDSTLLSPTPLDKTLTLADIDYSHNSIRIELVIPEFRADNAISYSLKLEGVDNDFSPYSTSGEKEYTSLHEGSYKLIIRAVNNYSGQIYEHELDLKILPPWWRTWWAYAIYFIIVATSAYFAFTWMRRTSQKAANRIAHRKEQEMEEIRKINQREALEKDYEIARLKSEQLEQDVVHKSEELTSTTMNLVRKNQILQDIATRLEAIDKDNNPEMLKIRRLIKENISHDDDWSNFTRHFDVVYRDFLKLLREAHPVLTQSDLRMCAYLKMGLSSKEIAPLLNISPRSVEMSRYRLRRKLALDRDTPLQRYLQEFGS